VILDPATLNALVAETTGEPSDLVWEACGSEDCPEAAWSAPCSDAGDIAWRLRRAHVDLLTDSADDAYLYVAVRA
jgi:hypothetical protein